MLAPHELKNKAFSRSLKGYSPAEVDEYIEFLLQKYTELYKENAELDRKLRIVTTSYDELRQEEEAIRSTLVSARKMSDRIVADANERADVIVNAVRERCERVVNEFNERIEQEKQQMWRIRSAIVEFKKSVFELYGKHVEELQSISVNELSEIVLPDEREIVNHILSDVGDAVRQEYEKTASEQTTDEPLPEESFEAMTAALEDSEKQEPKKSKKKAEPASDADGDPTVSDLIDGDGEN